MATGEERQDLQCSWAAGWIQTVSKSQLTSVALFIIFFTIKSTLLIIIQRFMLLNKHGFSGASAGWTATTEEHCWLHIEISVGATSWTQPKENGSESLRSFTLALRNFKLLLDMVAALQLSVLPVGHHQVELQDQNGSK